MTAMGPNGRDCLEANFILHNDSLFQLPKIKYFFTSIKSQTFFYPFFNNFSPSSIKHNLPKNQYSSCALYVQSMGTIRRVSAKGGHDSVNLTVPLKVK